MQYFLAPFWINMFDSQVMHDSKCVSNTICLCHNVRLWFKNDTAFQLKCMLRNIGVLSLLAVSIALWTNYPWKRFAPHEFSIHGAYMCVSPIMCRACGAHSFEFCDSSGKTHRYATLLKQVMLRCSILWENRTSSH